MTKKKNKHKTVHDNKDTLQIFKTSALKLSQMIWS